MIVTSLVLLLSFSACRNFFEPRQRPVPAAGKGFVSLSFASANDHSRTILPSQFGFEKFEFIFTPTVPVNGRVSKTVNSGLIDAKVELDIGNWEVAVKGFEKLVDVTPVATGTKAFAVAANDDLTITVPLTFVVTSGSGTLSWNITNSIPINTGKGDKIEINLAKFGGASTWTTIAGTAASKGMTDTTTLDAGYYNMTVQVLKDVVKDSPSIVYAKAAYWSDIVHIYPGQETGFTHAFAPAQVTSIIDQIWIVGIPNWTFPTGAAIKQSNGSFMWTGFITGGSTFRFSLTDTTGWGAVWTGAWFAPSTYNDGGAIPAAATVIGSTGNSMTFIYIGTGVNHNWTIAESGDYTIYVDPANDKFYVTQSGLPYLPAVANVALSSAGVASWDGLAVETAATGYTVELLKGGSSLIPPVIETVVKDGSASYDFNFRDALTEEGPGTYTVRVIAKGNGSSYQDAPSATAAVSQTFTQRTTVTTLAWSGDNATWTDTNGTNYVVKVYKDSGTTAVTSATKAPAAGTADFSTFLGTAANGNYTFTVTATGNGALILDSPESAKSGAKAVQNQYWLVGDLTATAWDRPGLLMTKQVGGTFTWEGEIDCSIVDQYFRISLVETGSNWYAPLSNGLDITVHDAEYDINSPNTSTSFAWKISATGWYKLILKPGTGKLRVERPITVDTIDIVETSPMELGRGTTYTFAHPTMTGKNTELAAVTFNIGGSPDAGTFFGSGANYSKLTIAAAEALASLSVTAAAGGETSSAVVINLKDVGFAAIAFEVVDNGGTWTISGGTATRTIYKTGNGTFVSGADDEVTFTISNYNGANTYTWYVDGFTPIADSAGNVTFNAANYGVGYHTVRLVVDIGGVKWSLPSVLSFNVGAYKF